MSRKPMRRVHLLLFRHAKNKSLDEFKHFIKHKNLKIDDLKIRDYNNMTLLDVSYNNPDVFKYLLEIGIEENMGRFIYKTYVDHNDLFSYLFSNFKLDKQYLNSLFIHANIREDLELIKTLIKMGYGNDIIPETEGINIMYNINVYKLLSKNTDLTPRLLYRHITREPYNEKICKYLLKRISIQNPFINGTNIIHYAITHKYQLLKLLIKMDIDFQPYCRDITKNFYKFKKPVINKLVKYCDINYYDKNYDTLLMKCMRVDNFETAEFLIKRGAVYDYINTDGLTAGQIADCYNRNFNPRIRQYLYSRYLKHYFCNDIANYIGKYC